MCVEGIVLHQVPLNNFITGAAVEEVGVAAFIHNTKAHFLTVLTFKAVFIQFPFASWLNLYGVIEELISAVVATTP